MSATPTSPTDARLADLNDSVVTLGPETLHVVITNGCNTNCVTCWDHSPLLTLGRSAAWKRQRVELATQQIQRPSFSCPQGMAPPTGVPRTAILHARSLPHRLCQLVSSQYRAGGV